MFTVNIKKELLHTAVNVDIFFFRKIDDKRARTPRWVIRFTSKLQGK
jgi:hypothetical protein